MLIMIKYIITGRSDETIDDALAHAMVQVADIMSEDHDVNISIMELTQIPRRGFKAVLDVQLIPIINDTDAKGLQKAELELQMDPEIGHIHERTYHDARKKQTASLKQSIYDHFACRTGSGVNLYIPPHLLINLNDAILLNHTIEKAFYSATHPPALKAKPHPQLRPPGEQPD